MHLIRKKTNYWFSEISNTFENICYESITYIKILQYFTTFWNMKRGMFKRILKYLQGQAREFAKRDKRFQRI